MPLLLKVVAFVQGLFMFSYQRNVKSNPEHDLISAACYVVLALEPTFSGQIPLLVETLPLFTLWNRFTRKHSCAVMSMTCGSASLMHADFKKAHNPAP